MKTLACATSLVALSFSHAQAAPLYPQRAQTMPYVEYIEPGYIETEGYNIHAGRELMPAKRPVRVAAPAVNYYTPAADVVIAEPPQVAIASYSAPQVPVDAPIEEQSATEAFDTALTDFSHDVNYRGNIEAGMQYSTGNTETQDYNLAAKIARESGRWINSADFSVANEKSDGEQSEEEYRAGFESDYKLSKVDFLLGTIEYVDDRFSGYDYRLKELLGYGRHWIDTDAFGWSSKIGGGYQHTKEKGGDRDDSPLGRLENDLRWNISERLSLENNLQADFSDLTIFRTETALKNQLVGNLFLKLGVVTEHLSDVPAGNENLDVDTMLNLSYEFE